MKRVGGNAVRPIGCLCGIGRRESDCEWYMDYLDPHYAGSWEWMLPLEGA